MRLLNIRGWARRGNVILLSYYPIEYERTPLLMQFLPQIEIPRTSKYCLRRLRHAAKNSSKPFIPDTKWNEYCTPFPRKKIGNRNGDVCRMSPGNQDEGGLRSTLTNIAIHDSTSRWHDTSVKCKAQE